MTNRISHWIDGKVVESASGRSAVVYNPATGEQSGAVDLASVDEVDGARLLTCGRVVDDAGATRCPGDGRTTDPVRDSIHAAPPC